MRRCGECTLCCKLLPISELGKLDNVRCKFQRHRKGCGVHGKAQMPLCCTIWSCRWLVGDDVGMLRRPDRCHYVIDVLPDYITLQDKVTKDKTPIEVIQIWIDPRFPMAYKDAELLAYLGRRAEENKMALLRWGSEEGAVLVAPRFTGAGEWQLHGGQCEGSHDRAEINNLVGVGDDLENALKHAEKILYL